jgi:hypothetical protein
MAVGPTDSLKLTFQVVEENGGKGVQPLQTFLRFYDPKTGEEGIQPLRVTPAGKSKFELVSLGFSLQVSRFQRAPEHGQAAAVYPADHYLALDSNTHYRLPEAFAPQNRFIRPHPPRITPSRAAP